MSSLSSLGNKHHLLGLTIPLNVILLNNLIAILASKSVYDWFNNDWGSDLNKNVAFPREGGSYKEFDI